MIKNSVKNHRKKFDKTIAFLQFGARGDVLYATPILRQVRVENPNSCIDWHIETKCAELIRYNYLLDNICEWGLSNYEGNTKQDKEIKMWTDIKEYANKNYDNVVIPQYWPDCKIPWDSPDDFLTIMSKCAGYPNLVKRNVLVYTTSEIKS